jgi:ParB-like chromosome segregation protein Spo0J
MEVLMQEQDNTLPDPDYQLSLVRGSVKAAAAGQKSSDLWKMPIDEIHEIPGFNVRVRSQSYQARVRAIADSILADGFHVSKPLAVFPTKIGDKSVFAVYDGYTRLAAAKLARSEGADLSVLPCVSAPEGTSLEDLTVALYTDNTGAPLAPYEMALVCKRLIGYGWTVEEVSKRLQITEKYAHDLLLVVAADRVVRDLVAHGRVSLSEAVKILRAHGDQAASVLQGMVERAAADGKDVATAKHAPGAQYRSAVRKNATTMAETLRDLRSDRGYAKLSTALRDKIDALVDQLAAASEKDGVQPLDDGLSDADAA